MKKTIVCSLFLSLLCGLGLSNAQTVSVSKVPAPTDPVVKNFEKFHADDAENTTWYAYQDLQGNEFYFATFTRNGDQKRIYYKNNMYVSLMTVIPIEYCPRKIKNVTASLHPDFKMAELVYMQSIYSPFYRATLTKGKKKKAERMTMIFSSTGELPANENDPIFEIIKELDVTPPTK